MFLPWGTLALLLYFSLLRILTPFDAISQETGLTLLKQEIYARGQVDSSSAIRCWP